MNFTSQRTEIPVAVEYPEGWYFVERSVPSLSIPRELFAISNRPIRLVPIGSDQPRPMIDGLDSGAMFVWCYAQAPDDPDPANLDAVPDYSRFSFPLRFQESEVFPSFSAREWDPARFLWRRVGFKADRRTISVWIWEGTGATEEDVATVERIVASVRPRLG